MLRFLGHHNIRRSCLSAIIIDGLKISQEIRSEAAEDVRELQIKNGITPGLAVLLVGDDPASAVYVRNKERACNEAGIYTETFRLDESISQEKIVALVQHLNSDERFHGILIQLPLPPQVDERAVILTMDPAKDVDGLHPANLGWLLEGNPIFVPCTPGGVQQLLMRTGFDPSGKHLVVCGRSAIVGKPVAVMMLQKMHGANATVTVCHTGTKNLSDITRSADILVVAMGRANSITADMVKDGVVVIDVGINRVPDASRKRGYRMEGDVEFQSVSEKAAAITPVPGGVGPMTVAMLLVNTVKAAKNSMSS